jgi:hypothetical protein
MAPGKARKGAAIYVQLGLRRGQMCAQAYFSLEKGQCAFLPTCFDKTLFATLLTCIFSRVLS